MGNWLACIKCGKEYGPQEIIYECGCGGLLEVRYEFPSLDWKKLFDEVKYAGDYWWFIAD